MEVHNGSPRLWKHRQGCLCRARAGMVEMYIPGIYEGTLEPGKAERIARKGLQDAETCVRDRTLVKLEIPGHYSGQITPADAQKMFGLMLKASREAKQQSDEQHVPILQLSGSVRFIK